jgi:sensor histidine kinase YesM
MKKFLYLLVFICFIQSTYCQKTVGYSDDRIEISFGERITASDLKIKKLTAIQSVDTVLFTLTYSSGKDRFLSFFNPPWGIELMYTDWKGIKKNDSTVSFKIAKADLKLANNVTMRFSVNKDSEKDQNFIFLNTSDSYVKKMLGNRSNYDSFFSRIFPQNFLVVLIVCFLFPILLFIGNKFEYFITLRLTKKVNNKWLTFNIKTLIFSVIIIVIICSFTGTHIFLLPIRVYFNLLMIAILPANFVFMIETLLKNKKLFWLSQYLSLTVLLVGIYVTYLLGRALTGVSVSKAVPLMYIVLCGFLIGFIRIINNYISYQKILSLKEKELQITRLGELKVRSDLNALQSKINPHFLYNALNSIAELCWKDPEKTERMALSLSKLFRYTINKEESDFNPLKTELEIVSLYLMIEKERFGDHLNYEFDYSPDIETIQVPKFTIQPLIENAIKHGVAKKPAGGFIKLKIQKKGTTLEIKVYDNGPDFPVHLNSGYGLQSIYDKLDILYPKRYSIELYNGEEKNITLLLKDGI